MVRAEKQSQVCVSCHLKTKSVWNKGHISEKKLQAIKDGLIWEDNGIWYRRCFSCQIPIAGSNDNIYRRINTCCCKCRAIKNIGRKFSLETRQKQRVSAIKRIQKYQLYNKPNFNPDACDFIDALNYSLGFNFRHALNGGELWVSGFYPDGYDKDRNIVFEYDEPHHNSPKFKLHDKWRETCIINNIRPEMFIRYDEKTTRLYDSITGIDIPVNPSILI